MNSQEAFSSNSPAGRGCGRPALAGPEAEQDDGARVGSAPPRQAAGNRPGGQVGQEGQRRLVGLEALAGRLGHVVPVQPGVVEPQHAEGPHRDRARHPWDPAPPTLAVQRRQVPAERVGGRLPGLQPDLGRLTLVGGHPGGGPLVDRAGPCQRPAVVPALGGGQGGAVALGQVGGHVRDRPGRGGGHVQVPCGGRQAGQQPPDPAVG